MPCGVGGGTHGGRKGWLGKGWVGILVDGVREAGQGSGGGCKGFGSRGVARALRDGANFATGVVFLSFLTRTKRRKTAFFEGCPVVPTGAGLVDGGVDQGP